MRSTCSGDGFKAGVFADAVFDVDDQIAGGEALGFFKEILGAAFARAAD